MKKIALFVLTLGALGGAASLAVSRTTVEPAADPIPTITANQDAGPWCPPICHGVPPKKKAKGSVEPKKP